MSLSCDFTTLPGDLRRHLLLGFSGRLHLHAIAPIAFHHSHRAGDLCSAIGEDALLSAWGENPFDGTCVAAVVSNADKCGSLPVELVPSLKGVLTRWQPEITPEARAAMEGEPDEQLGFLKKRLAAMPESMFWWHHLYEFCRITGHWAVLAEALAGANPPDDLVPLFSYAQGNALLASGENSAAIAVYKQCRRVLPLPIIEERLATAIIRMGKTDKAAEFLRNSGEKRSWNVSLLLRLHELAVGGASAVVLPEGKKMVLGYSWNKADDLAETLRSLGESDLDNDTYIRILNNGSTDHTAEVVAGFRDTFGKAKVEIITLPVNVGAPPARNWLMSLPEVRESDYAAYIDDDISLPKDWLGRLGAAAERYPAAGVWGTKVVEYDGPARVQCGEHNLTPSPQARTETLMSTIMLQDGDFGQADYIRPCASVTGCVHLFKTSRLLANGEFDLRFSPTQYDDLERDLRMVHTGGVAVYTGHLAIPHKRKSGRMSEVGKPESGGAAGNLHKLLTKYTAEEFEAMAASVEVAQMNDLLEREAKTQD